MPQSVGSVENRIRSVKSRSRMLKELSSFDHSVPGAQSFSNNVPNPLGTLPREPGPTLGSTSGSFRTLKTFPESTTPVRWQAVRSCSPLGLDTGEGIA